ncbi:MAG: hypothetical protein WA138_09260 [Parvibaculum sp.]
MRRTIPVIIMPLRGLILVAAIVALIVSPLGLRLRPTITGRFSMPAIAFGLLALNLLILRALAFRPLLLDLSTL